VYREGKLNINLTALFMFFPNVCFSWRPYWKLLGPLLAWRWPGPSLREGPWMLTRPRRSWSWPC